MTGDLLAAATILGKLVGAGLAMIGVAGAGVGIDARHDLHRGGKTGTFMDLAGANPRRPSDSSMDIGLYWSSAVLEHKLERGDREGRQEEVWNCRHLPRGLGQDPAGDRLVIGCQRRWIGAFRLASDVLFTPEDPAAPYALIFDVKSWTRFPSPTPCKPFRGWTYLTKPPPARSTEAERDEPPSTDTRNHRR